MIFRKAAINFLAVFVFSVDTSFSFTFVPSTSTSTSSYQVINNKNKLLITPPNVKFSTSSISRRFMSESSPSVSTEDDSDVKKDDEEIVFAEDPTKGKEPELNVNDIVLLKEICMKSGVMDKSSSEEVDENVVEQILFQALPSMSSQLLMALRKQSFDTTNDKAALLDGEEKEINQEEIQSMVQKMGPYLETIVDTKLEQGRELLKSFLDAGELRRLDTLISKAAQKNELNMAFFSVLNLNIKDAYEESVAIEAQKKAEAEEEEENKSEASRFSILQHIYTRCQEEVEKTVDPGVALLNKLLRTSVKSIRTNQIEHYLTPQKTSITSPDGKTIELPSTSSNKTLVSHEDFVSAIEKAVQQIRMVENSGGTDRQTAANLTESCRQVAIETRMTIAQVYGIESDELKEFEKSLQPVFRPQG
eukprot:CAMPEP_0178956434 /NCGR_PEP_ID=MMETSP0789-20121207/10248_1 /TAXON_ID=3005 /ORGANISM="Rhizosolenia setigera, Strain CCMP 1694" /LENGTH=418 /DNA_ID=CAMNT_0020638355 /DNA_START=104 /DNA_END=1360 /DNA_ORIENTATION=-